MLSVRALIVISGELVTGLHGTYNDSTSLQWDIVHNVNHCLLMVSQTYMVYMICIP